MATQVQVTFDCADPAALSTFWAAALGYRLQDPPEGFATWEAFLTDLGVPEAEWNSASAVVDPDGGGPRLYFQRVPEPKAAKNRVHLDLNVGGPLGTPLDERKTAVGREVKRVTDIGAEVVREVEERGEYWVVMRDPEGNEFCLQ
jgi:catechol 2,3-dioxygenase-like lactoylglutathione lyase family enzyme